MNRRQKKKCNKYEALRYTSYSETNVLPTNWSEIRWSIQWIKRNLGEVK